MNENDGASSRLVKRNRHLYLLDTPEKSTALQLDTDLPVVTSILKELHVYAIKRTTRENRIM